MIINVPSKSNVKEYQNAKAGHHFVHYYYIWFDYYLFCECLHVKKSNSMFTVILILVYFITLYINTFSWIGHTYIGGSS